jgi:hypothetical protein
MEDDIWHMRNSPQFLSSITQTLQLLCEQKGFQYAEIWIPSDNQNELLAADQWYSTSTTVKAFAQIHHQFTENS